MKSISASAMKFPVAYITNKPLTALNNDIYFPSWHLQIELYIQAHASCAAPAGLTTQKWNSHIFSLLWISLVMEAFEARGESRRCWLCRSCQTSPTLTVHWDVAPYLEFSLLHRHRNAGTCHTSDIRSISRLSNTVRWTFWWWLPTVSTNGDFCASVWRPIDGCSWSHDKKICQIRCQISHNAYLMLTSLVAARW